MHTSRTTNEVSATMINKSSGVTETERILAEFCERTFLKLWSYLNPFKDDGHELCDLLAVFGDYVFIFFDRENQLPEIPDKDPQVLWDRWKRNVVDRQVKTAHGAERYILGGRPADRERSSKNAMVPDLLGFQNKDSHGNDPYPPKG